MFLPTEKNQYRPAFLDPRNLMITVGTLLVLELAVFVIPFFSQHGMQTMNYLASVLPSVLNTLTNEERTHQNLPPLVVSPLLEQAATWKAQDMAANQYFAHTSPDGKAPWYWFDKVGYKYTYAGENLAVDFSESNYVTRAWMESPSHRANIVKQNYTEVGTGVALGHFEGRDTIFVVQLYANPAPKDIVMEEVVGRVAGATGVGYVTDEDMAQFEDVEETDLILALAELNKLAQQRLLLNNEAVVVVAEAATYVEAVEEGRVEEVIINAIDYGPGEVKGEVVEEEIIFIEQVESDTVSEQNLLDTVSPTGNFTSSLAYIIMNIILVTIAILVLLAILLKIIAIKQGKLVGHYFDIVLNALLLVVLVVVIYFLNSWLVKNSRQETVQSAIDFANQQNIV